MIKAVSPHTPSARRTAIVTGPNKAHGDRLWTWPVAERFARVSGLNLARSAMAPLGFGKVPTTAASTWWQEGPVSVPNRLRPTDGAPILIHGGVAMSGQWKGVFGASRASAHAAGVIASRWPAVDKISGDLDKESAWVDKIGGGSRAEEAEGAANLQQTLAGFARTPSGSDGTRPIPQSRLQERRALGDACPNLTTWVAIMHFATRGSGVALDGCPPVDNTLPLVPGVWFGLGPTDAARLVSIHRTNAIHPWSPIPARSRRPGNTDQIHGGHLGYRCVGA